MNDQNFLFLISPNDYIVTDWIPQIVNDKYTKIRYVGMMDNDVFVEIHSNFSFSNL